MEHGEYIMEVRVDIDPEHEEEWNQWYNEVHLPEIVDCPGFHRARRYMAVQGSPKYIAIYDIEDEKVLETSEFATRRGWKKFLPFVKNPQVCVYKKMKDIKP